MNYDELVEAFMNQTIDKLNEAKPSIIKNLSKISPDSWLEKGTLVSLPWKSRIRGDSNYTYHITTGIVINPGSFKFFHPSTLKPCNLQQNVSVQVLSVQEIKLSPKTPLKIQRKFMPYYHSTKEGHVLRIWSYNPRSRVHNWRPIETNEKEIGPYVLKDEQVS